MKLNKLVIAVAVTSALTATAANATFLLPTSYDKQQDAKISQNASDIDALQAKDSQLRKDIDTTYALANTKYTEAAGKNLERQVSDLQTNKVDKSVFAADQARQDKVTAELNSKVDGYATQGAAVYNELKGADKATNDRITDLQGQGQAAYNDLSGQISGNKQAQAERDASQDEHINAVQGAAQTANDRAGALETRADAIETQAGVLDGRVGATEGRLDTVEGGLRDTNNQLEVTDARSVNNATRLDSAEGAIRETNTQVAANDKAINTRVDGVQKVQTQHSATLADHETRISTNTSEIKKTQTVVKAQGETLVNHETRITNNETNISNLSNDYYQFQDTYNYNNQVINQNMQAYRAQAVQQSKAYTDQQVGQLRNEVRDNQKEYRSGIASVAAMANIPVVPGQTFTVGAGIGQFKDRTALAVGVGANISQNVAAKASVGFSNDSDAVVGAGIGFGF